METARAFGALLAQQQIQIVYGGARVGTMGALADGALAAGGQVVGVMPQRLVEREVAHQGLTQIHVVDSMHTRKALMADLAEGFVALPGGFGTYDELFEILTWAQIGLHHKPVGLLNVAGFYTPLLTFLQSGVQTGFVPQRHLAMLHVSEEPQVLLARLLQAQQNSPVPGKWSLSSDG